MSYINTSTRMLLLSTVLLASCSWAAKLPAVSPIEPTASATSGLVQQAQPNANVQLREDATQVHWPAGIERSKLAPESRVVRVLFDAPGLQYNQLQALHSNKTKQAQEFETHRPATDEVGVTSSSVASARPSSSQPVVEQQQQQGTSTELPGWPIQSGLTSTPTTSTTTTDTPNDGPVGSKTSRQGAAILCGEANSNGKSNQRLVSDRIVGGYKTEPGEFPFQVRLNIRSRRGSGICGGVILDEGHILTAAHCMTACVSQQLTTATIENTGVRATIGDHSIRSNDGEIEVDIEKITPHEKYDACNFYANDHDIALIKTSTPVDFRFSTDGYGSINRPCMPPSSNVTYRDGEQVIVSGWGVTRENSGALSNILRYVQVPVVNTTRCQETYGTRVTQDHVCAGLQSGGKDSCQGDSGGPLVRVVDNRYELVGIVSFGYGCGQPSAPGVYTRVASYIDWIKANL